MVWTQHGEKRAVWRCTSRLDYGRKYCKNSPTLDEEPLQQAVLAAINTSMSDHGALTAQITDAMEQELTPVPGESMSLCDIDRAMAELGKQFDNLLIEASNAGDTEEYAERFRAISSAMDELKRRKANIQNITANHLMAEADVPQRDTTEQLDLFTNYAAQEKRQEEASATLARERKMQEAMLSIKKRFGKNAILKGMNLEEGATARNRNQQIGGHHE